VHAGKAKSKEEIRTVVEEETEVVDSTPPPCKSKKTKKHAEIDTPIESEELVQSSDSKISSTSDENGKGIRGEL
jgi:hypothetical protein